MARGNSRSAGVRPREQFWLDHLRTARQQGQTLKAYAQAHGLSVSALYTARSTLKRRGVLSEPAASAPTLVPVRIPPPAGAAFRVHPAAPACMVQNRLTLTGDRLASALHLARHPQVRRHAPAAAHASHCANVVSSLAMANGRAMVTVRTGASSTSPPPDRSPIRKVPAGTTTSSGHASQSRTTSRRARPRVLLDPRGVWRRWSRQWRPPTVPSNPRFRTARHLLCASVVGELMRRSCSNQSACGPSDRHLFRPDPWRGFESAESLPETCAARGGLSMTGKRSSVPVLEEVRLTVRSQHSGRLS